MHAHFLHVLVSICMLSRRLLTKISASELSRKFIKSALLVGNTGCFLPVATLISCDFFPNGSEVHTDEAFACPSPPPPLSPSLSIALNCPGLIYQVVFSPPRLSFLFGQLSTLKVFGGGAFSLPPPPPSPSNPVLVVGGGGRGKRGTRVVEKERR